ncbi:peptidase S8 and S53 subtilisin kexin sedolisin [Fictibacillus macauensis ZFHKF-1]|uniref:Peptidase S8 and S53 subtilisin kexin sedolisin n=1 Tax=Fictibacillus macauensis ZFHKF-1 TaxID=1196324 RepID=I8ALU6_9BACL|nr:S8 family serine peptidase [Fictibacillus macauensis]EIT86902.1 peptidase S8 and S53 subtilisin kexin sedolisin [Fictibacillus macauensis ZFHKF-1]
MKQWQISVLCITLIFLAISIEEPAVTVKASNINLDIIHHREIILKLKEGHSLPFHIYGVVGIEKRGIGTTAVQIVRVPRAASYQHVLSALRKHPMVTYAQPNYYTTASALHPNDALYSKQWALRKINWSRAVATSVPAKPVIIAVLDSGVNPNHPDLKGKVLRGADFVDECNHAYDHYGHGTAVAGVIAASSHNGIGVSGMNDHVRILPVRIGPKNKFTAVNVAAGITYAVDHGAKIINMSFGGEPPNQIERDAIQYANRKGVILIAAGGNLFPKGVMYPAAYKEVISVGATREDDGIAHFSSRGKQLDLTAPGVHITTTNRRGTYSENLSGTSFSAPLTAGLASLIVMKQPTLTPGEVEYIMEKAAYIPPMFKEKAKRSSIYGYGRIDVNRALHTSVPAFERDSPQETVSAKVRKLPVVVQDQFDLPFDVDTFAVKVSREQRVTIDVSPVTGMDPVIETFDVGAHSQRMYVTRSDAVGMSRGEHFSVTWKPGIHYISLTEANNHWSTTPYTLSVK